MRILFPLHGFLAWNGGVDLARSIASALRFVCTDRGVEIIFANPVQSFGTDVANKMQYKWQEIRGRRAQGSQSHYATMLGRAVDQITGAHRSITCDADSAGIVSAARAATADVVFPTMLPLGDVSMRRVSYVYDFQHKYLPQNFSRWTRFRRDQRFRALAQDADAIVVNSRAVAADAERFLGISSERIVALPFAPHSVQSYRSGDENLTILKRYGLQAPFLMVCNHFWVHKDHDTAIRAFAEVIRTTAGRNVDLVLTGDPIDHRNPAHFDRLRNLTSNLGVADRVHFLGLVPKLDQLALLSQCEALIQPTLFEGGPGGGSVAEAIGLGVRVLVSDIPVNREIDQGHVVFFRAGDSTDLAQSIMDALQGKKPEQDPERLAAFARNNLSRLGHAIIDGLLGVMARKE